ncbi:MAG: YdcF family protein [Planctomycetes bacterium]|nr:YdcF family protein [Planctomycetota bacterium]
MIVAGIGRGLALFFGVFSILNLAGSLARRHFDMTLWWVDPRMLPLPAAQFLLTAGAVLLVWHGLVGQRVPWRRGATIAVTALLGLAALGNGAWFYVLWTRGEIRPAVPVPLSLFVLLALGMIGWSLRKGGQEHKTTAKRRGRLFTVSPCHLVTLSSFLFCILAFPLGQIFCFGKTSYERPADVAVVLGARAYRDGSLSDALADRVRTGIDLYKRGVVGTLVFSGGPGDGTIHETEAMRRFAIANGVRDQDIILDPNGTNTSATAVHVTRLADEHGWTRILAVSHYFHLPRTKMAFQREGLHVYTVPARESYVLTQTPYLLAREVVALWAYYLMIPT